MRALSALGNQSEPWHVAGTNDREMTMVKSGQLPFSETLYDRENRGVNEAERQIPIAVKQFANAAVVLHLEVDNLEPALLGVGQEAQKRVTMEALARKPVNLNDHRGGDKHLLLDRLQQACAGDMVLVCAIHSRV